MANAPMILRSIIPQSRQVTNRDRGRWLTVCALLSTLAAGLCVPGCSRPFWRKQADQDSYALLAEKLNDPLWQTPRIDIQPDRASRFFDPYDPDCGPLPPDDPAAHEFMHCAGGIAGSSTWHKLGQSFSVENPHWLDAFGLADDSNPNAAGPRIDNLTLSQALELSYIHSREYQTAIEELYLSALDLTFGRFQFAVRYLGLEDRAVGRFNARIDSACGRFDVAQLAVRSEPVASFGRAMDRGTGEQHVVAVFGRKSDELGERDVVLACATIAPGSGAEGGARRPDAKRAQRALLRARSRALPPGVLRRHGLRRAGRRVPGTLAAAAVFSINRATFAG
jgi:hypothetical protein